MNIDARINVGLPSHPKTKKLIKRGGQAAGWNLICLFLWVSQNKPDGDLSGMSDEDIEIAAGWEGEDGGLVKLLSEVRFLDGVQGAYTVHDWEQHNPWAAGAVRRSENSRAAARARWGIADEVPEECDPHPSSNAGSNANPCDPHADSNAGSAKPQSPVSVTKPTNQTKPTKPRAADAAAVDVLVAEGVPIQVARDWMAVRKTKKLAWTETAWDGVKKQAQIAGLSIPKAVTVSVENGWGGFKAAWLDPKSLGFQSAPRAPEKTSSLEEHGL